MTDDIVTRLRGLACPECGLPSTHNQFDEAADEIERLRLALSELANRYSAQEARHYRIIRSLEAERDQWQRQAVNRG